MSDSKEIKISKELDFTKTAVATPQYVIQKVTPQGSSDFTIGNSSTQTIRFELPTKAINFAKSYLQGDLASDTAGAAYTIMNIDSFPMLDGVLMQTRGGTPILNMTFLPQFLKVMNTRGEPLTSYLARTPDNSLFYPSNALASANLTYDNVATNPTVHYNDNKHYIASGNAAVVSVPQAKFYLADLKETILALDKNIMFPEIVILQFTFANAGHFFTKSSTAEVTGTLATYTNGATFKNVELHLAIDTNKANEIAQQQQLASRGYSVTIPYPMYNMQNFAGSTATQNVGITLSSSSGRYLRKIYHSIFRTYDAKDEKTIVATSLNNSNKVASKDYGGLELYSYHTELNSDRLQPYDLSTGYNGTTQTSTADFADWKAKHKNDPNAILSRANYYYNWAHVDDWTNGRTGDNEHTGIPINGQVKWDFMGTCPADCNTHTHYTFIVLERELVVNANGVAVI